MNNLFDMMELEIPFYRDLLQAYIIDISRYKKLYLLGAGKGGIMVAESLKALWNSIEICFVDSDPTKMNKTIYKNIKCIEWSSIEEDADYIALLTSIKNTKEMVQKCKAHIRIDVDYVRLLTQYMYSTETLEHRKEYMIVNDILADNESRRILKRVLQNRVSSFENVTHDICSKPQYFREEFLEYFSKEDVLLDCGAYIGDSIELFKSYMKDKGFKDIYAFEMDIDNYNKMKDSIRIDDENIHIFNFGVGKSNEIVRYTKNAESSSYIRDVDKEKSVLGEVVNYDSFSKNEKEIKYDPTVIKMDIEGAEMDALQGMENTIRRSRPKLLISIYHFRDDLWRIPLYLYGLLPEYSFYLRHHTDFHADTVLYGFDMRKGC